MFHPHPNTIHPHNKDHTFLFLILNIHVNNSSHSSTKVKSGCLILTWLRVYIKLRFFFSQKDRTSKEIEAGEGRDLQKFKFTKVLIFKYNIIKIQFVQFKLICLLFTYNKFMYWNSCNGEGRWKEVIALHAKQTTGWLLYLQTKMVSGKRNVESFL